MKYQSSAVTNQLIKRIIQANNLGIYIRYIAVSGFGEPTLHPEFNQQMLKFTDLIKDWSASKFPPPKVGIVTNGSTLTRSDVWTSIADPLLSLSISIPTFDPDHYGHIVINDPKKGKELLNQVTEGIRNALSKKKPDQLFFHLAPPVRDIIRHDFHSTVVFLTKMANQVKCPRINIVLFPATSNRIAAIEHPIHTVDLYTDLFSKYNGKIMNSVRLSLQYSMDHFFYHWWEILHFLIQYNHPCFWNANFLITADGTSTCCNDQSAHYSFGDIFTHRFDELLHIKKNYRPEKMCQVCDQNPRIMNGSPQVTLWSLLARWRLFLSRL